MKWVDEIRTLKVRANAETPLDASTARNFGCEGIGLCRTEHMFFDPQRIIHVREMIVANTEAERRTALDKLLPYQRDDFVQLFTIMAGLPVTIRLLDPPLHEFLPHTRRRHGRGGEGGRQDRRRRQGEGVRSCTNPIRCSATAAAVSASPIPRSTRCSAAPSSRRSPTSR